MQVARLACVVACTSQQSSCLNHCSAAREAAALGLQRPCQMLSNSLCCRAPSPVLTQH